MEQVFELAKNLINIESISGNERACAEYLKNYLEGRGWNCEFQWVTQDRPNLFAWRGSNKKPRLLLNSHIDTVPPFYPHSEDENYIYGRGACDTKALIAAQIFAAESVLEAGFDDIGLLYVVGEEVDHVGIKKSNELKLNPEFLIVAEPTDLKLASRQKGYYRFILRASGVACHSGYPEAGSSAIHKMLPILNRLTAEKWPDSEIIGKTTLNIGRLKGGIAGNILADSCKAEVVMRVADQLDFVKNRVSELVDDGINLEVLSMSEPMALGVVDGVDSKVVSFHTDIPYFDFQGTAFLIGAGSILDAHTANEKIRKDEVGEMIQTYESLMKQLLQ